MNIFGWIVFIITLLVDGLLIHVTIDDEDFPKIFLVLMFIYTILLFLAVGA